MLCARSLCGMPLALFPLVVRVCVRMRVALHIVAVVLYIVYDCAECGRARMRARSVSKEDSLCVCVCVSAVGRIGGGGVWFCVALDGKV